MLKRITSILLIIVLAVAMVVMTGCAGTRMETMYWKLEKVFGWEYVDDEGVEDVYAPIDYYITEVMQPRYEQAKTNDGYSDSYEQFLRDYEDRLITTIVLFGTYNTYIEQYRAGRAMTDGSYVLYYNGGFYVLDTVNEQYHALSSSDYTVVEHADVADPNSLPTKIVYDFSGTLPNIYSVRMSNGAVQNVSPASAYDVFIYLT
ncbi:MAG: hypothetical protein PHW00_02685 [Clostridia bacterium]|nr:hypothetical protein [Clostridia bacterium]